jgi:hypothetical protein|tara:strand:- start:6713 stop:7462 length:750 start_codon:yes stop_codon:yes gene_type:complete
MRIYVIASVLIILGLTAVAYKGTLPENDSLLPYLNDVSSALLVSGLLGLLFKVFQDKESESNLRRLLRIHDSVDELGLCEIMPEVQAFNFTDMIHDSSKLSIVMNDGLRWIGNNTVALQNRFSKRTETDFFLIDPDSEFVPILAGKISSTEDDLKRKIQDAWTRIEGAWNRSEKRGSVKIYKLKTYPTKSMFLSESALVETPYQTAAGRATIPVYIYAKVARDDSPYQFSSNDISELRAECELERELKR